jgi:hypothetical protein
MPLTNPATWNDILPHPIAEMSCFWSGYLGKEELEKLIYIGGYDVQ